MTETQLNNALQRLFSSQGPAKLAQEALLSTLMVEHREVPSVVLFAQRLRDGVPFDAVSPHGNAVPDLVLVGAPDEDGAAEIYAVVEVKLNAQGNVPYLKTAALLPEIDDAIAASIRADLLNYPEYDKLSQIDLYRTRKWWVRTGSAQKRRPSSPMKMTDPSNTLWLLFDSRGRSAADAFLDKAGVVASSSAYWLTVDLWEFYDNLRPRLDDLSLPAPHLAVIGEILSHIEATQKHRRILPGSERSGVS
ncbi:hypothetical protein [Cryobacterium sp. AP23]